MSEVLNCPLCNSLRQSIIISSDDYKIIECKDCKIGFTTPKPTLPDYEKMDFHSKSDSKNLDKLTSINDLPFDWKRLIQLQVDMVKSNYKSEIKILEIGCGEGILLEELRKVGFKNIEGFEPSTTATARARKRGLAITNEYFSNSIDKTKYDLIIMSHVFEHIEKLDYFLIDLSKALNTNGSIMFTQTNYKGIIPLVQKKNWYAWVPEQHFWHFTLTGLTKLMEKYNFDLLSKKYTSLVHPQNFLYKISSLKENFKDQFISIHKKND